MHETHYTSLPRTALVAALEPIAVTRPRWENWARTFQTIPRALFVPTSVHHCRLVLELARRDHRVLRPVGIGHSPSDVACTRDYMLSMTRMNAVLEVNPADCYVVAEAGITLMDLHVALAQHGLAMRNLGSISDQTLAGIVATPTHGSGVDFGVMSTHVLALTILTPDNTIVSCSPSESPDLFNATVCGLGATGLILTITLEVTKAFRLRDVQTVRPFGDVVRNLDELKREGEHVRLWWFPAVGTVRCMASSRTQEAPTGSWSWPFSSSLGFHAVQFLLLLSRYARPSPKSRSWAAYTSHVLSLPAARLTRSAHIWAARLMCYLAGPGGVVIDDSVKVFNVECRYPQHTIEWALPSARAKDCLRELGAWLETEARDPEGERPHFPIEIRFSARDELWLSPSNGGETCWVGIVQFKPYNLPTRYRALFSVFERILTKHEGRPHWAKAHHLDARAVRQLYPQFDRFVGVLREVDPEGTFRNEYIERHFLGRPGASDGREYKTRQLLSSSPSSPQAAPNVEGSWWAWLWPKTKCTTTTDWRSDWRIAPPKEEVECARDRSRGLVVWLDEEEECLTEDGDASSDVTLADADASRAQKTDENFELDAEKH
ncbi:D-arabinono-1,4-lactone oxidase-domain-containing protein [Mycena galopus ATCC 62051]|nr:D-arabinono-1,4-lactone oxidase-domain-containing protein [Mycena galopus ATCC 62051]